MHKSLLLSTKILPHALRERIVQNGLAYMEYNAIRISPITFEMPPLADYVIFSSQNATNAVLKKAHSLQQSNVLCVGKQSENILLENRIKPLKTTKNMSDLTDFIKKIDKKGQFLHFCGNRRLPILSKKMKEWECNFKEIVVYQTEATNTKIEATPSAVLFFSPSGVESHEKHNDITNTHCFCIGSTTAASLKQTPKSVHVMENPNTEQLVAKAIHYFKVSQHA
ncbi:MAG: uroporphyrinogen-III synthase [Flavobacteriaceae bacterium]